MAGRDEYQASYNETWQQLIRAATDPSVSPTSIRKLESEGLARTDRAFQGFGSQISRYPEVTHLEHRTNIQFLATTGLRLRPWGAGDGAITREEYSQRLRDLKSSYLKLREVLPSFSAEGPYWDELKFIEGEQKRLAKTAFNPIGCLILILIVIVIAIAIA